MSDLATANKAGFFTRAVASIIDAVILLIVWIVLQSLLGNILGLLVALAVGVAYVLSFWTTTGQTIGHKAMGLRVIRTDGTRLDLSHAMLRYIGAIASRFRSFLASAGLPLTKEDRAGTTSWRIQLS